MGTASLKKYAGVSDQHIFFVHQRRIRRKEKGLWEKLLTALLVLGFYKLMRDIISLIAPEILQNFNCFIHCLVFKKHVFNGRCVKAHIIFES